MVSHSQTNQNVWLHKAIGVAGQNVVLCLCHKLNCEYKTQASNFRKTTLALLKHSLEPSAHEAARNVQIIGTQCVTAVPVGVFNSLNMLPY